MMQHTVHSWDTAVDVCLQKETQQPQCTDLWHILMTSGADQGAEDASILNRNCKVLTTRNAKEEEPSSKELAHAL